MTAEAAAEGAAQPLNVLVLSDYFPPHIGGGVERAAYELSRRIAAQGHHVTVLTLNTRKAPARESMEGMAVIRVDSLDLTKTLGIQLGLSFAALPALWRLLKPGRWDLIHAHSLFFQLSLVGVLLARLRGIPVVTTAHLGPARDLGGRYGLLSSLYEQTLGRAVLKCSTRVIGVSEAVARHVRGLGSAAAKTVAIPNGVDVEAFKPRRGAGKGETVIFVGRLIFNKGPQFLVEALPAVATRFPEARFQLIGEGPLRSELETRVARAGLGERVRFLGEREDVPALLAEGDLLVRPSLLEGLPLAVLEAMACGLPIIATPVGGTPEVVKDGVNGFLVKPGDVSQLTERLCDLLADAALRRKMGRANRSLVEQGYSWDEIATRTLAVYRQACLRDRQTFEKR